MSNDVEEIINWLNDHDLNIKNKNNSAYDFSVNENVNYWLNKLYSKEKYARSVKSVI
ncbi:MAG: hypothetical protein ACKPKO_04385 [Candidatus Fonsibacter sp.]